VVNLHRWMVGMITLIPGKGKWAGRLCGFRA
jgi:hypothetical protein